MEEHENTALITNDAVILGILLVILAVIFKTSSSGNKFWKKFYTYIPVVLLCYFVPSLLNTFHIVDGEKSGLYFMSTRYLLPACLFLLTMSVDMREIFRLGPKALIMFFTATAGVILGGPLAVFITSLIAPDFLYAEGGEPIWRGLTTIAGSWIGGGANQAAMFILFKPSSELYSVMITVDVIVAEIWMAVLLFGVGKSDSIDRFFNADNRSIERLKNKMEQFSQSVKRVPTTSDFMVILGLAFGATAVSHLIGDNLAPWIETHAPYLETYSLTSKFFWLVVIVTLIGIFTSFTKLRGYEGAGASKIGSVFIFILVASIGMKMDIMAITRYPELFMIGLIWMAIHVLLMVFMAWLIKAPYFFLAVGSKANIGGAASAPVVAATFHPSLAPVGVLLAVLGYAVGTYGAWLCGVLMSSM